MNKFSSRTNPILAQFRDARRTNIDPIELAELWLDDVNGDPDLFAWSKEGEAQIDATLAQRVHAARVLNRYVEVMPSVRLERYREHKIRRFGFDRPRRIDPMPGVVRVHTAQGSHIEPEFDADWHVHDRLAWKLAVLEADTGVRATLYADSLILSGAVAEPTHYSLTRGSWSSSGGDFDTVWRMLSWLSTGYQWGFDAGMHAVAS